VGFLKKWRLPALHWLLIMSLLCEVIQPGIVFARGTVGEANDSQAFVPTDLAGNWAEKQMMEWIGKGLIQGFQDGTIRPNALISRIEFITLVNRLFAYKGTDNIFFKDVPNSAWFAPEVRAAAQAGFVQGYPDGSFQPSKSLLRVEAAVMLSKLVPLMVREDEIPLQQFRDQDSVPSYGRAPLGALLDSGYVQGFTDQTIRPSKPLTRAEAVVLLDRIAKQSTEQAGGGIKPVAKKLEIARTYGPASGTFTVAGDLIIQAPGTILRNVIVKGDLTIAKSVGDGDVFLHQVVVQGQTSINGGGENSIHIDNSQLGTVVVDRKDGRTRVVIGGTTVIEQLDVLTAAKIEAKETSSGSNVSNVSNSSNIGLVTVSTTGEVTLTGHFGKVVITDDVKLTISSGTIDSVVVNKTANASLITLSQGVIVSSMELHGTTEVKGTGKVRKALVDAPNVEFETKPESVTMTDRGTITGGTGGGIVGGGGGGGTTNPPVDPIVAVNVTASQPSTTGFRLAFSTAVPNLGTAAITLRDAAGNKVTVDSAATLNDGQSYRIAAALFEGEAYTVTLTKTGYSFGSPLTITIPSVPQPNIEIAASVETGSISSAGFRVLFSKPVAGLTAADFAIKQLGTNNVIVITGADTTDNGASYVLSASLAEDVTYTVSAVKAGYSFGNPLTVFVPITKPDLISIAATISDPHTDGFTVLFSEPVKGLTQDSFSLADGSGEAVTITAVETVNEGASYLLSAALVAGEVYTLTITKSGYSFGMAQQFALPGTPDVVVVPTTSHVSRDGFILSLDRTIADLDPFNFDLQSSDNEKVGIDMLSAVDEGKAYEIWAELDKNKTYTLSLNKEGYVFGEPVKLKVEMIQVSSSVGWVTHQGFMLKLDRAVGSIPADAVALTDADGNPVPIDELQLGSDGKSVMITAKLTEGDYQYRLESADDRYTTGVVQVPATVAVSKYTTFNGLPGGYTGLTVHFSTPVLGLTAEAFQLTNGSGNAVVLDGITTVDHGSSYSLQVSNTNLSTGGPYTLAITAAGYDFGTSAVLGQATLNLWNASRFPVQFMAGLNPYVPNLTAGNFTVKDMSGKDVAITNVSWDGGQRIYIVSFEGVPGQSYMVAVRADGYDFGAPRTIRIFAKNMIINASSTGFTLGLNPPLAINTEYGFALTRADGSKVTIHSAVSEDGGASYQVSADLRPGYYQLRIDAETDMDVFSFIVPVVATLSVNEITSDGLTVSLSDPVDLLDAGSFVLVDTATGDPVNIQSAVTVDQGKTYRLAASLRGGHYNLKLIGHLPEGGVNFEAAAAIGAGTTAVMNVTNSGFDLKFDSAVAGLIPANLDIRDGSDNRLTGITLSTQDGGMSYRVHVNLISTQDYTLTLKKENVLFSSPVKFHVNRFITGSITDVTTDGHMTLRFSPAFPEIENYLGLSLTDASGTIIYPNLFESKDGGSSYKLAFPNRLQPGGAYTLSLSKDGFSMSPISVVLPPLVTVTEASTTGLKVELDAPIPGLTQNHFSVKSSSGQLIKLTAALTEDEGAHYTLTGNMAGGKYYTVQYKAELPYQVNLPVLFPVMKSITASVSQVTPRGIRLEFSEKVPGLRSSQLMITDQTGQRVPEYLYSADTSDQGLSYQISFGMNTLQGEGYTLLLQREDFRLTAPVMFIIPGTASVQLLGTLANKIMVQVSPDLPNMTAEHFTLLDSRGKRVAFTVSYAGSGIYNLLGSFNLSETYTLESRYPGYDFGQPIKIGLELRADAYIFAQTQYGFRVHLTPPIPNFAASDMTIKDEGGNAVAVQGISTTDAGATYDVRVPLAGGKTYTVAFAKDHYRFGNPSAIVLNAVGASVDRVSLQGFTINLASQIPFLNLTMIDEQGQPVKLYYSSSDGGLSYGVSASLSAGVRYTLSLNKLGYDFGMPIPILVQAVATTFAGMESGNNQAFTLRFDRAMPNMRPSDFKIMRVYANVPVLQAVTTDGGYSYKIEASFWGGDQYTVLPLKDGYDFGSPVVIEVPIIVSTAVLRTGADYVEIGLNPAVPGLTAGNFKLVDNSGSPVVATAVTTSDSGATYRVAAAFNGGATYSAALSKNGYDFGEQLDVFFPSLIAATMHAANAQRLTVKLAPTVGGLTAGNFSLRDSVGQIVAIKAATEFNGGGAYEISAALTEGETYTLAVSAVGYSFGSALTAAVPVTVDVTSADITSKGFTVKLNKSAPGLTADRFRLLDGQGQQVIIQSVVEKDGGQVYQVKAALKEGSQYALAITRKGYDFGIGVPLLVPIPLTASITAVTGTGFTLRFQQAVTGLSADNVSLVNASGAFIRVDALTTADDGLTYTAVADLSAGGSYVLNLAAQGYEFGQPLHLELRRVSASEVNTSGFILNLSAAIPSLSPSLVELVDGQGNKIALTAANFVDMNKGNDRAGQAYRVSFPLTAGTSYTLTVKDPAHPVEGPLKVILPLKVQPKVVGATIDGVTLSFSQPQVELQADRFELKTATGEPIPVHEIVPGATPGTYVIRAALAEGSSYTLHLGSERFDFGAALNVQVLIPSLASVSAISENGFTISLTRPVPELKVTLLQGGNPISIRTVTTPDYGQTYRVEANLGYDKAAVVSLSKAGYDLGDDMNVTNVTSPPLLVSAVTDKSGTQLVLTFDKPLASVGSSSGFSVKLNGKWLSGVTSALADDPTQVVLTWKTNGSVIDEKASVAIGFSGMNRVKARNERYLAVFEETPVVNATTLLGFVMSYALKNDAMYPAKVLRTEYGKTALETAKLLRDGGFKTMNYYRAVYYEYSINNWSEFGKLLQAMNTDAMTLYDALYGAGFHYYDFISEGVGFLISAGYTAGEIIPVMRKFGVPSAELTIRLKRAGVSAKEVAAGLDAVYNEKGDRAAQMLRNASYNKHEVAEAVQSTYSLTNAAAIRALSAGQHTAVDAASVAKELFQADAAAAAGMLLQAGYSAAQIGAAVTQNYSFASVDEFVSAFLAAEFNAADVYAIARGAYAQPDTAAAMLIAAYPVREIASAVRTAGDSPGVIINALGRHKVEAQDIAAMIRDIWGTGGTTLSQVMVQFGANGYDLVKRASLLNEVYRADIATAIEALYAGATQNQRMTMIQYLFKGGYEPVSLAAYFIKNVYNGSRQEVYKELKLAGMATGPALRAIHDAVIGDGKPFTLLDATQIFYADYSSRYDPAGVISALRFAFAEDSAATLDATAIAKAMNDARLWEKLAIGEALKGQMGLTFSQWIELERTDAFAAAYQCPCAIPVIVRDTKYLFGTSIEDITVAMSLSKQFTLDEIVEGTIAFYPTGGIRANGLPYLTAALKNGGYPFEEVAAVFDSKGWTDWIGAFSKQGIASSDVVAYLKSTNLAVDDVITRLAPYPLKEKALVLREQYSLEESAALTLLLRLINDDKEEISRAVSWAYGGNPIVLWLQALRSAGATATSALNTLVARYPAYKDLWDAGPALIKGGFSQEEVMKAIIARSSGASLKANIALMQQLYGQQQFSIAQLLAASSSESPASGIDFLRNAGYRILDIAGALMNYYKLTTGEAAQLLTKAYPNQKNEVLLALSSVYGGSVTVTISEALAAEGISTMEPAVDYLRNAGFGLAEIAAFLKEHFSQPAGKTALLLEQKKLTANKNVLMTTIAAVYDISVEMVIHAYLVEKGITDYAAAIPLVFEAQFSLATSIRLAKNGYGLPSGEALQKLLDSKAYRQADIVNGITDIYKVTAKASVVEALAANHLNNLADAVPFLSNMSFNLQDMVRVGKEHYLLDAAQTTAALLASGSFGQLEIQSEVAYIYGQTLAQSTLDILQAIGVTKFADAIAELRNRQFSLDDIVLAAKSYYKVTAGEATAALLQSKRYAAADILETIAGIYGKPITQNLDDLLRESGIAKISEAAPFLRSMGYALEDVIGVSRSYYGNSAKATIEALSALQLESVSVITLTVQRVYGEGDSQGTGMSPAAQELDRAGVTSAAAAVEHLWQHGFSLIEIAAAMQGTFGKSASEALQLFLNHGSLDLSTVLSSINAVYGSMLDAAMITALQSSGAFKTAGDAAQALSAVGYRMDAIVQMLKSSYGKSGEETKSILAGLNKYSEAAIKSTVDQVYGLVETSAGTLQELLELYGIKTAEGAVIFLCQQNIPLKDIVQYLKSAHQLESDKAVAMLTPYYSTMDIGWAVIAAYYNKQNIGVLLQMIPPGQVSSASGVVGYMKGKFTITDIVLALKVLFQLDALAISDAMMGIAPAEQVRKAVAEVLGSDPLFAYLKRMKDTGSDAASVAAELDRRGLLESASDTHYLVDMLVNLGFDNDSILKARYYYYNSYLHNAGSAEEQAKQLIQLGADTPAAIVKYVSQRSRPSAIEVIAIVRAALPKASIADTALIMRDQGYDKNAIMGALDYWELNGDDVAAILKKLGITIDQVMVFLKNRTADDKLHWIMLNGYTPIEYLRFMDVRSDNTIATLRASGMSADDIAIALFNSTTLTYNSIAKALHHGGFTKISDLASALIAARDRPKWVLGDLLGIGNWSIKEVAKGMLDSKVISLVDLVDALQMANGKNFKQTYQIIKEISTSQRQEYYDALSTVERKLLSNNDIAVIVTISAFRQAGISITEVARQLRKTEVAMYDNAAKLMVLSGFNIGDVMETVWDEYRDIIGIVIIQKMIDKVVGSYLSEFNDLYKLSKLIATIVAKANK